MTKKTIQKNSERLTKTQKSILDSDSEISLLHNKHFFLEGSEVCICLRKNGLETKPPLYLWNLTKHVYVSSLKKIEKSLYRFDVKGHENYNLKLAENSEISVEKLNLAED